MIESRRELECGSKHLTFINSVYIRDKNSEGCSGVCEKAEETRTGWPAAPWECPLASHPHPLSRKFETGVR